MNQPFPLLSAPETAAGFKFRPMARALAAAGVLLATVSLPATAAIRVERAMMPASAAEPYVYVAQVRYPQGYGLDIRESDLKGPQGTEKTPPPPGGAQSRTPATPPKAPPRDDRDSSR